MPRNEVLQMLEEADLFLTAAVASEYPPERILAEWRKFVSTVERRYEPERFERELGGECVYEVREIKGLRSAEDTREHKKPNGDASPSV